jgi:predicted RNase H-like HicB family nuclease
MRFPVEVEREEDGRWLAEVPALPGCLAYGDTRDDAVAQAVSLAMHVLADRIAHGEASTGVVSSIFAVQAA